MTAIKLNQTKETENRVLMVHRYIHCELGSHAAKKPGVSEKYGSWSRIPESANRDNIQSQLILLLSIVPALYGVTSAVNMRDTSDWLKEVFYPT